MDWFLCYRDLRHERVKALGFMLSNYIDLFGVKHFSKIRQKFHKSFLKGAK